MKFGTISAALALTFFASSAFPADSTTATPHPLAAAAAQMKLKNYSAAAKLVAEAPDSGQKMLLAGMAAFRRGNMEEAARLLAKGADSYPLLSDYALHFQAKALISLEKPADAAVILQRLIKSQPNSPLARKALLQLADIRFEAGSHEEAEALYTSFIEKYASGSDAISASYKSAICREKMGDVASAVKILRNIWLTSPASPEAGKGEKDLQRLAAAGAVVPPYSARELFKRGSSLYDQRSFDQALKTFRQIDAKDEKKEFSDRLGLKIGQTLLKMRRYQDAEQTLAEVAKSPAKSEIRSEAAYLLAKAVEKGGRDEDALAAYRKVADDFPKSAEADDALLDAAFIRKFQFKPAESVKLLADVLERYPDTKLKARIIWESGWGSYLAGKHGDAQQNFKKLLSNDEYRERALYWLGKSALATGDKTAASDSFTTLLQEFPFGYYALITPEELAKKQGDELPKLPTDAAQLLPLPDGFERVKGLLALGLPEEAGIEMAAAKKKVAKGRSEPGLARLFLETGSFNSAMQLINSGSLKRSVDSRTSWALLYPAAYQKQVTEFSTKAGVSPSLVYAVMRAESAFLPTARSPVGARGLMQLMPETAASVLREKKIDPERLYDPDLNIRLGTKHLKDLLEQYKGDRVAVIASYNAGAHNVNRWKKTYGSLLLDEFVESIPFGETRDYVKKVLAAEAIYRRLYELK